MSVYLPDQDNRTILSIRQETRKRARRACGHLLRLGEKACRVCKEMKLVPIRAEEKKSLPFYLRP